MNAKCERCDGSGTAQTPAFSDWTRTVAVGSRAVGCSACSGSGTIDRPPMLVDWLRTADVWPHIEAIRERPDEDLPRLVLADRAEEAGFAEWGEFVRVQVELAASMGISETDRDRLLKRERKTLKANWESWWPDVLPSRPRSRDIDGTTVTTSIADGPHIGMRIVRGFIGFVRLRAAVWVRDADAILAHPLVVAPAVELTTDRFAGGSPFGSHDEAKQWLRAAYPAVRSWTLPAEPTPLVARNRERRAERDTHQRPVG